MILAKFKKQPLEVKDYTVDYAEFLAGLGDTIQSVATSVQIEEDGVADPAVPSTGNANLTVGSVTFTDSTVKAWVQGGKDGGKYKVTIRVTTTGGRVDESELRFTVRDI